MQVFDNERQLVLLEDLDQSNGGLLGFGVGIEGVRSTAVGLEARFHTLETLSEL